MNQVLGPLAGRILLCSAIGLSYCGVGLAQQAPQSTASTEPLQEIIVTGSRIAAPNEVSTSPIQVLNSQYLTTTGKTDISDIIEQLPQIFNNSLGQDLGNGTSGLSTAGGVATADLRGLGPNRTLVLVDGRRLGQGSPNTAIQSPAPDLDQIPAGLVDRVEVVTGGASAAYGSDAIAGVVNFIMKHDFQGFEVDGQYNENMHHNSDAFMQDQVTAFGSTPATGTVYDGRQRSFDVLMGNNFDDGGGNVTAYLSYRHADAVPSVNRDFGGCELGPTFNGAGNVTGATCVGSSNSNYFQPLTGPNAQTVYSVAGSSLVPYGSVATSPPAAFNSQPYINLTREDDRYNAAVLAHDKISDYFEPYAEVYFMDDRTHQAIAPVALFKDSNPLDPLSGNYNINCSNPLLSAQQQGTLCTPAQIATDTANPGSATANVRIGRRNIEGGGRETDYEHENYRAVLGSKGDFDFAPGFSYDVYGQYYYTTFFNSNQKYFNFQSIDDALLVTGTKAAPTCISGGSCVPYNPFSAGGVTPAQLNYLYINGTSEGNSTLRTTHGEITGQLGNYGIKSPFASDGVAIDVGFEHRNDHEYFQPDSAEQSGLIDGFGSASVPIDETVSVTEGFTELRAPLAQDLPGIKDLLFDGGFRYSNYSTSGGTRTYKFELQYAPTADVRLRGSYDKAIRAPSVVELYNPQLVGLGEFGTDPCAPPITYSLQQCQRTGVTAAQYAAGTIPQGTGGQLSQLTGGNPNLQPEQAETYTVGLNFTPTFLPHFSASVDYYHIALTHEVGTIPYSTILDTCANTGNPVYCSQIVRSPATGGLTGNSIASGGYVTQTNVNIGAALVSGIDTQFTYNYELPAAMGGLEFNFNGSYLQHDKSTPLPGAHTYDCAGLFGFTCQTNNPRWRHILRATWSTPWNFSTAATWRYIGHVTEDNNTTDPTLQNATYGAADYFNGKIPSYSYLDLEATWHVNKIVTLRAGVNNVLDKDPPLVISEYGVVQGGGGNTIDGYDVLGRQLFASFSAKF